MTMPVELPDEQPDELRRELDRVVDRLNTMPLHKAEQASADCHRLAAFIVDHTPGIPVDAVLPPVGVNALGAQLAVVGRDFLRTVTEPADERATAVAAELARLRRSLP